MAIPDSQRHPWHLYLINNVEDVVVFLDFDSDIPIMFSCSRNAKVTFVEKQITVENNQFLK